MSIVLSNFHSQVHQVRSWKVGKLESWKVGKLESWKVGKLLESKIDGHCRFS